MWSRHFRSPGDVIDAIDDAAWTNTLAALPAFNDTLVSDFDDRLRDMIALHDVAA